ncbi:MAG: RHS repeat-associated core domain-containing protein, partial [Opitutales bacterium]|nr:RHS repeat-associated core domain-containing protein [Opitutales bacterium]
HTTSQPKFRKKFRYDYMSRRVEERYFTKAGSLWFPEYTRRYIYDGYTMVAELDVSHSGTVTTVTTRRTFAWGHETAGGGIGALLLVDDHPNDRAYYPGYDGRGSVTLLVDADTGEKVAGMEYDVWGKLVRATGEWRATPFLYDTKWSLDQGAEGAYSHWPIGLYDYGFRMYQPATGRFISRDPVREEGGLNLYQAFSGDPVNRTDFLGLFDEGWPGPIIGDMSIGECTSAGGTYNSGDGKCYFEPDLHEMPDLPVDADPIMPWERPPGWLIPIDEWTPDDQSTDHPQDGDSSGGGSGGGGFNDRIERIREEMREECRGFKEQIRVGMDNVEKAIIQLGVANHYIRTHTETGSDTGSPAKAVFDLSKEVIPGLFEKAGLKRTAAILGGVGSVASAGMAGYEIGSSVNDGRYGRAVVKAYEIGAGIGLYHLSKNANTPSLRRIARGAVRGAAFIGVAIETAEWTSLEMIDRWTRERDLASFSMMEANARGDLRRYGRQVNGARAMYDAKDCDSILRKE